MKLLFKNIDFIFLMFLLFLTQGSLPLKIVGIFFILTTRVNALNYLYSFNLFYFTIIFYHLVYGVLCFLFESFRYLPTYFLSLLFWVVSYISLSQVLYFFKKHTTIKVVKTIDAFFLINVLIVLFQFIDIMYLYDSLNPYGVSTSAGDFIKSIYSNSSVNSIIMGFFAVMYLLRKKWVKGSFAVIILTMTTYMSGLVIFIISIIVSLFIFSKIKLKYKFLVIISSISMLSIFKKVSPNNVTYVSRYVNRVIANDDNVPFKIKSFRQTYEYSTSSLKSFVFGAGAGNFSSRSAFISSGDYVNWYPDFLTYAHDDFQENHLALWNYDFRNPWDNNNNTANQPFSFYNQIIGEYGLIGILLFLIFYVGFIIKKWPKLTFTKFLLVSLVFYFVLDYWFEYFSVIIIFELLVLLDIKLNSKSETNIINKTH
jgi:hypothetical protein